LISKATPPARLTVDFKDALGVLDATDFAFATVLNVLIFHVLSEVRQEQFPPPIYMYPEQKEKAEHFLSMFGFLW
jgi:hypothetical protein